MKLYKTSSAVLVETDREYYLLTGEDWDAVVNRDDLYDWLLTATAEHDPIQFSDDIPMPAILPPIGTQEVWAAGVTYYRSREARMEESEQAGGGSFYDRVYDAERPELFFKSSAWRVVGDDGTVRIRKDSVWNVPEPELTLFATSSGRLVGYTIGNDMSSRSIEGENPLYLPQAKSYDGAAALGPCLYVHPAPLSSNTLIEMTINRQGHNVFSGHVAISQMKRTPEELLGFLFRETSFPAGVYLMTGTGIIPDSGFTLEAGDTIHISIEPIGTLTNTVG